MKRVKFASILFLVACLTLSVFSSCGNNNNIEETTTEALKSEVTSETTEKVKTTKEAPTTGTTVYSDENYTYHSVVYQTEKATDKKGDEYTYNVKPTTEFVPITIVTVPKTTKIQTTKIDESKTTVRNEITSTRRNPVVSTEPIKEISKGISLLTKTNPVLAGNSITITILGNPGKSYSIEFYDEGTTPSVTSGLETKKATNEGVVSWTFSTSPVCSAGNKKIVIKENGSDNYIQTSITVN